MPELPELEVYRDFLSRELITKSVEAPRFLKPYLLKSFPPDYGDSFPAHITAITRRGKHLLFSLDNGFVLCVHLMRSGRIFLQPGSTKPGKFIACTMVTDDGRVLQIAEYGKEKMARFSIAVDYESLPEFANLGIEPFDSSFTLPLFRELLRKHNRKLKRFLTDQHLIAGIGNAYANEIVWHAELSPFSLTFSLNASDADRLFTSMRSILEHSIAMIRAQLTNTGLPGHHRSFMSVHGKKDEPCPRCGDTIRWVYSTKRTTYYCPACQTKGKILKDRRTSRFLR